MISPFDIDVALKEVHRCVKELGFRAIFMRANVVNGRNWYDAYYEPLWAALEEYKIPLGFHESSSSAARQIGDHFEPNFMLRRIVAQPMEQMVGMVRLVSAAFSPDIPICGWRFLSKLHLAPVVALAP